jgi:small nuclear ribonucleoprotein (snRNP)-like protein
MSMDIPTLLNNNKNKIIQIRIRDNKTIRGICGTYYLTKDLGMG